MIKLYTEQTYQQLFGHLLKLLIDNHSVFHETWIVVPNHSAKQWLQKSLAKTLGVCAQIKFIMPLSFNWEILKHVAASDSQINVFSKDVLRWSIYGLLMNDSDYQFLKQKSDIENFNLSEKIAQILLTYNDNRPEIIAQWDNGLFKLKKHQEWQANLWCKLLALLKEQSPVQLLKQFDPQKHFKHHPNKIILFATEQLTTFQKDTILKLSDAQDIHIMVSNPCPNNYWFDLKPTSAIVRSKIINPENAYLDNVGNPLLANLGYNKMALFDVFLNENIELNSNQLAISKEAKTLLDSVKADIHDLKENSEYKLKADNSIKIHSCHSRFREVEIINDEILHFLDTNKDVNPEDIIVVAPDINDYIFSIKEVFGDLKSDSWIPFHIDRVQLADHNYINALMQLLNSFNGEMTASVIYELLTQMSIYEKLNLSEDDLPRIKSWILDSNIRNFYSVSHKNELGFQSTQGNTWQFGENRWISGYLSGDTADTDFLSTFGDVAGQEELFNQCFEFLKMWFKSYHYAQQNHTPHEWLDFIKSLCVDLLHNDYDKDFEQQISQLLDMKLKQQTLACDALIPLTIVNSIVESTITENNFRSEGQIGVRFQSWENAFIVDAKVMIIMGLNDGEFPKKEIKNDLDIFNNLQPRLNKSIRQRDKNLMLTALTESCEQLLMTYIGFNAKTNDSQPPSVVLADLIEYLAIKTNDDFKVHVDKMHGFNKAYYSTKKPSYNAKNFQLAQSIYCHEKIETGNKSNIDLPIEKFIELDNLCAFFSDPMDYFLKNFAGINNNINNEIFKDTETYFPDSLELWQLKNETYNHGIGTAIKTGIISDNQMGQLKLKNIEASLSSLKEWHKQLNLHQSIIDFTTEEINIVGAIETDENNKLTSITPSKATGKRLCYHWVKHLCYQVQRQQSQDSYAFFEDKKVKFNAMPNAHDLLHALLLKWSDSHQNPWLFFSQKWINASQVKALKLYPEQIYFNGFIDSKQGFPSEGQKYFYPLVKQYDFKTDVENFLQPILDSVEFFK